MLDPSAAVFNMIFSDLPSPDFNSSSEDLSRSSLLQLLQGGTGQMRKGFSSVVQKGFPHDQRLKWLLLKKKKKMEAAV